MNNGRQVDITTTKHLGYCYTLDIYREVDRNYGIVDMGATPLSTTQKLIGNMSTMSTARPAEAMA